MGQPLILTGGGISKLVFYGGETSQTGNYDTPTVAKTGQSRSTRARQKWPRQDKNGQDVSGVAKDRLRQAKTGQGTAKACQECLRQRQAKCVQSGQRQGKASQGTAKSCQECLRQTKQAKRGHDPPGKARQSRPNVAKTHQERPVQGNNDRDLPRRRASARTRYSQDTARTGHSKP